MENKVVVSVCVLTYNQEDYIRQTIESVLLQKCNFQFEIIIGEDCSTDDTRRICLEYKSQYPDTISLFFPKENIGVTKNSFEVLSRCLGRYIAFCEGDDYWTDPYKLQRQVDFMEKNPDYSLVYHKVNEFWEELNTIQPETINTSNEELTYSILDLAKNNFIHTPSVLIRSNGLNFTKLKQLSKVSDYYLWMLCAQKGKIKYFPEIMAVYRVSINSTWALKAESFRFSNWLIMLTTLLNEFTSNQDVHTELFVQAKEIFKGFYNQCVRNQYKELLDVTTKKLLLASSDFQVWWFIYMLHIKAKRGYRIKYYFYLLSKQSLNSIWLLKKCLY